MSQRHRTAAPRGSRRRAASLRNMYFGLLEMPEGLLRHARSVRQRVILFEVEQFAY
jgi:hypothetical protein